MKRQSALVVFSDGQDSTTCLCWAKEHYETVEAVTFAYGQRHHLEIQVAREIAKEQGIRHHILDMSLLGQSPRPSSTAYPPLRQPTWCLRLERKNYVTTRRNEKHKLTKQQRNQLHFRLSTRSPRIL